MGRIATQAVRKDGEKTWALQIEFTSKEARDKFQACALAAFDTYMGEVDA